MPTLRPGKKYKSSLINYQDLQNTPEAPMSQNVALEIIPQELHDMICASLDTNELANLCLTSKTLLAKTNGAGGMKLGFLKTGDPWNMTLFLLRNRLWILKEEDSVFIWRKTRWVFIEESKASEYKEEPSTDYYLCTTLNKFVFHCECLKGGMQSNYNDEDFETNGGHRCHYHIEETRQLRRVDYGSQIEENEESREGKEGESDA
ncbi:MAG: hypothetical protein M1834_002244 [Cirrosporium novae-zelandiae]|nr:MAG: hypothetical protein M1834_002244 [Cirrosporium novae-zelandiae]